MWYFFWLCVCWTKKKENLEEEEKNFRHHNCLSVLLTLISLLLVFFFLLLSPSLRPSLLSSLPEIFGDVGKNVPPEPQTAGGRKGGGGRGSD